MRWSVCAGVVVVDLRHLSTSHPVKNELTPSGDYSVPTNCSPHLFQFDHMMDSFGVGKEVVFLDFEI